MKLFTHIFRYLQVPPPTIHRLGTKGYNIYVFIFFFVTVFVNFQFLLPNYPLGNQFIMEILSQNLHLSSAAKLIYGILCI
jgi:hypothetical protein